MKDRVFYSGKHKANILGIYCNERTESEFDMDTVRTIFATQGKDETVCSSKYEQERRMIPPLGKPVRVLVELLAPLRKFMFLIIVAKMCRHDCSLTSCTGKM